MKFVDLFAGCGGLSLGVERAGGQLVFAVEKSDMAARTFFHNNVASARSKTVWSRYVGGKLREQARAGVIVRPVSDVLDDRVIMRYAAAQQLDLVVGGPPCQGFSMAGRRNKDDVRNKLAWEYLTFVEQTSPKMVVIENVVGMSRSFVEGEDSSFHQLKRALELNERGGYRYEVQAVLVNAMHFGAPQFRPRLMLIALRGDIAECLGVTATDEVWKSGFRDEIDMGAVPSLAPVPTVSGDKKLFIRDAIADLDYWPSQGRNAEYLGRLREFESYVQSSDGSAGNRNHNKRRHTSLVVKRFSFYRVLLENNIDQKLLSALGKLDEDLALRHALSELKDVKVPVEIQTDSIGSTETLESVEELAALAWLLRTKKHSQKVLAADAPSRTVVTLPDDYGHPIHPRTFTVRELARFQGFPDNFEFMGKETTGADRRRVEVPQYTQVGNAVSPWQSFAVAKRLKEILDKHDRATKIQEASVGLGQLPSLESARMEQRGGCEAEAVGSVA